MTKSIQRVTAAFLVAFAVLAVMLGRWSLASSDLTARDDNPRRVFQEQEIQRGAIVDHNNQILAETVPLSGTLIRRYLDPDSAPVVGYDSINYGQAGVEEAADRLLRGPYNSVDQLLHHRQFGQDVRLTIDASTQALVAQRLTQPGAVVVLSVPDGAVLALESNPSFDPNTLDRDWKTLSTDPAAPLLNRATQGLYQPGAILESVILAEAIERGTIELTQTFTQPERPLTLNGLTLTCAHQAEVNTLAEAYANACPTPFADLGVALGEAQLISITQRWHLDQPPTLELRTSAAPTLTFDLSTTEALQAYAVGQGELTISPLHMALVAATIANLGVMPKPYVIDAVQSASGEWAPYNQFDPARMGEAFISPMTAQSVISAMHAANHVAGHGGAAFSGNKQLSWFIGLAPIEQPKYAIAVLIETPQGDAATEAESIGRGILEELLRK
jgi:peptidoglycan glycosyltransferase